MADCETQAPSIRPLSDGSRPRKRRFGRWAAPVALAIAVILAWLVWSRPKSRDPDEIPLLPANPALLAQFPKISTGWLGHPQSMVPGDHLYRHEVSFTSGIFTHNQTDLFIGDTIPINLTRSYLSDDSFSRSFGIGASISYDIFLVGDVRPFAFIEVTFPDGARVFYSRVSKGVGYTDAVYIHRPTDEWSRAFDWSIIRWNGTGWNLRLRNGAVSRFLGCGQKSLPGQCGLISITNAAGERLKITRDPLGNILQVTSPNGAKLWLTHDRANRITSARDSRGEQVEYQYDARGRLAIVKDANGGTTRYSYNDRNDMTAITRPDGKVWLTNEYDDHHRVTNEIFPGGSYQLRYTLDGKGNIRASDVLGADGFLEHYTLDAGGDVLSRSQVFVGKGSGPQTKANL